MVKKLNISFLLHLPPPVHGSAVVGKWITESDTISERFNSSFINLLASESVDETGRFKIKKIWSAFKLVKQVLLHVNKRDTDMVYYALTTTGLALYRDFVIVSLLKLKNIPIVFHLHNKGIRKNSKKPFHNFIYSHLFASSDVILLSDRLYNDISNYVARKDVHICPNGIPVIEKDFIVSKKPEYVSLLFLSNLIESKGILILLHALQIVKDTNAQFHLNIAGGEGDINAELLISTIKSLGLQNQVSYLGKQYGKDKSRLLSATDIFIFPTYKECFPLVLLEALQFGLPIVTTNEGGIPEIVEHRRNGLIVEKKNIEQLAEAIIYLIENADLRKEMGMVSHKQYNEKYKLEHFEENLSNILDKVLKNKIRYAQ